MIVPKNLKNHYKIIQNENIDIAKLFNDFSTSLTGKLLRLYISPILNLMPTKLRYFITNIPKRMRNPSKKIKINYPLDFKENKILAEKLIKSDLKPWFGKKAVLSISHDVDNDEGYKFVAKMADMDIEAGINSTFNFLTNDNYTLEEDLLDNLSKKGFEIGLHGYRHDQGFSYRTKKFMKKKLLIALDKLKKYYVVGTRTPALSKSNNFFSILYETGISYDSSLQIGSAIYKSVIIPYPFYNEEYNIWEIPLMIQDDNYLRDAVISEDKIILSLKRFIDETVQLQGVMVLNIHPHLMWNKGKLYSKILSMIKEYSQDVSFKSTKSVYEYIKNNVVKI